MKTAMKIVSVVFHPLLLATMMTGMILQVAPESFPRIRPEAYPSLLSLVFTLTGALPGLSIYLLKKFKYISDLELMERGERLVPFLFILVYYLMASYLFWVKLDVGLTFRTIMVSVTFLIALLTLISLRFKISIHATAIWCGVGFLSSLYVSHAIPDNTWLYSFILCAGLTSASRLYLGYHTDRQVASGAAFGFFYGWIVLWIGG